MKKTFVVVLVISFFLFQIIFVPFNKSLAEESKHSNWVTFQHDYQRTGVSEDSLSAPLREVWKTQITSEPLSDKDRGYVLSNPVVEDHRLYIGTYKGNLVCIDTITGKILWKTLISNKITSPVTIGENNIYVFTENKYLQAFSKETGEFLWKKSLNTENVTHAPVFYDGTLYVRDNKNLIGYDEKGEKIFTKRVVKSSREDLGFGEMTLYKDKLYFYSVPANVSKLDDIKCVMYCFDIQSKEVVWREVFKPGIFNFGFFLIWSNPDTSVVVLKDNVGLLSSNGMFYWFNADTGDRKAENMLNLESNDVFLSITSPVVYNDLLYFAINNPGVASFSSVFVYSFEENTRLWERSYDDFFFTSPVISESYLYLTISGGEDVEPRIIAINIENGNEEWEWEYDKTDVLFSSMAIADETLFFASSDGYLHAFKEDYGDFNIELSNKEVELGTGETKSIELNIKFDRGFSYPIIPKVEAPEGISVSFDKEKIEEEGTLKVNLTASEKLLPGDYKVKIILDGDKVTHDVEIKVKVSDILPPSITPNEELKKFINKTSINVQFKIEDNITSQDKLKVTISVDGNPIENVNIDETGTIYQINLTDLNERKHNISIEASDEFGNKSEFTFDFVVDITKPEVELQEIPRFTNKETLKLIGETEPGAEIVINDKKIEIPEDGRFEISLDLIEGENNFDLKVSDKAGNFVEKEFSVFLDKAVPKLEVSIPYIVDNKTLVINGKVTDGESGIDSLTVNGYSVDINSDGNFTYKLDLVAGENSIILKATDKAGNSISEEYTVIYEVTLKLQIGSKTMYINDTPKEIDVPPTIVEGRTLLPIRWVAEPLGAEVGWNGTERKVTVTLNDTTIELWIGKPLARVNGVEKPIDPNNPKVVPMIIKGRTMLPVRFVAENLGCRVEWDGTTKTVTIIYPGD